MRESKARLEFTLAAAHVGEWEIDVGSGECRHSDLYDRCFGYGAPVPGWNLDMLLTHLHAGDRDRVRSARGALVRDRRRPRLRLPRHLARRHRALDRGARQRLRLRARPAKASLHGCASSGIIADITQRKHTEATLRDADLRKDEFLATLAHELRNPLAPIRNAVQIMQLSRDETMHEKARKIIERQLKQMVHLVDDLLDVSRISQGKVELRLQQVDVADAVLDAIETSRPLIDAGRHHLTTTLAPPRALMVEADATRVTQIVANLLNNAAKYTPEGGHIQVTGRARRRRGADHRAGLGHRPDAGHAAARLRHVRAGRPLDGQARRAAWASGWRWSSGWWRCMAARCRPPATGPAPGLPLRRAPAADPPPGTPAPRLDGGHELAAEETDGLRVLVVDDNVDSADSLSQVMQILGYPVAVAHDGVEAVEMAAAWRPAVVLMDIGMPRMSGLEAARAIRVRCPAASALWLIALSGWGQNEDRRKSHEAGFDHHFVKPVDVEALIELIRRLPKR